MWKDNTFFLNTVPVPLSEAREEKPLVVEMLSSSCCERLSLISLTKEKPVEKGPGAEEVEGWEKRLLEAPSVGEEASSGEKCRWERLRGGRDNTYSWKFSDARLVEGSGWERKVWSERSGTDEQRDWATNLDISSSVLIQIQLAFLMTQETE